MATGNDERPRDRHLWAKAILAISLSLNLLVVGVVVGAGWKARQFDNRSAPRSQGVLNGGVLPFIMALPEAARRNLRDQMQAALAAERPTPGAQPRLADRLLQALRRAPFEAEDVAALMREQQSRISAQQEIGQRMLLSRIRAMTDSERAEYADRVERTLARRSGSRNGRRSGG